jgi:hypothetical protein
LPSNAGFCLAGKEAGFMLFASDGVVIFPAHAGIFWETTSGLAVENLHVINSITVFPVIKFTGNRYTWRLMV